MLLALMRPVLLRLPAVIVACCLLVAVTPSHAQRSAGGPREIARVAVGGEIEKLAWSPDGERLVALSNNFLMTSINTAQGTRQWQAKVLGLPGHSQIDFVDGGTRIVSVGIAPGAAPPMAALHVWDAQTGRSVRWVDYDVPMETLPRRVLQGFALSEDRTVLATSGDGRSILMHDTRTWLHGSRIGPIQGLAKDHLPSVSHALLDMRRERFVGGRVLGQIFAWSLSKKRQLSAFKPLPGGIGAMVLVPATGHIIVGGNGTSYDDPQNLVGAFDPATASVVQMYRGPGLGVRSLALEGSGRYVGALKNQSPLHGFSTNVLVWNVQTGQLIETIDLKDSPDGGIAFSPDGRSLAYGARSTVYIVRLDPQKWR